MNVDYFPPYKEKILEEKERKLITKFLSLIDSVPQKNILGESSPPTLIVIKGNKMEWSF